MFGVHLEGDLKRGAFAEKSDIGSGSVGHAWIACGSEAESGSRDAPERGCSGVTADQTAAVFAQLGGVNNADTEQNITQYFETVPSQDLGIALRMDREVKLKDVNRVAREYLTVNAIAGSLEPEASGQAAAMKGFGGKEKSAPAPTKPVALPSWGPRACTPPQFLHGT